MRYGKIINGKLVEYDGKSVFDFNGKIKWMINVPVGMLIGYGYRPVLRDEIPALRFNEQSIEVLQDIDVGIHVSYSIEKIEYSDEEIDQMKREAYINESDHLYMAWQKYLILGDSRAENAKELWTQKVQEIQNRFLINKK